MNNETKPKHTNRIEWNRVTWYSKLAALIVFILLAIFSVYVGMQVQKIKDIEAYSLLVSRAHVAHMPHMSHKPTTSF